jgi:hypothetical protein
MGPPDGRDIDWCLRDRPADPYRADLEALLGEPAAAQSPVGIIQ